MVNQMRTFLAFILLGGIAAAPATAREMAMRVFEINDHVLAYYDGRPPEPKVHPGAEDWTETGAYNVGVCTYVIHQGHDALVYDTFPDVRDAQWVRHDLARRGITHFTVVNSHWHLDHVGGNAVYADVERIATARTIETLRAKQAAIESGTLWGPPAIQPLVIPNVGVSHDTAVWVGTLQVMLKPVNIHSADGLVIVIPSDRLLLAGDTLEDTVTFVSEPEHMAEHIRNLESMKGWNIERILPNHGDPKRISSGGYTPTLIDATVAYLNKLQARVGEAHDPTGSLEDYVSESVARGWVSVWWAYRAAHADNMKRVAEVALKAGTGEAP